MKNNIIFTVFLLIASGGYSSLYAQASISMKPGDTVSIRGGIPYFSIFDSFEESPKENEGLVIIHQPEAVKQLVGTRIDSENAIPINGKAYIKTIGYRIRVYKGNNQRVSKEEANSLKAKIKERYPEIESDVKYDVPWWILFVGNFRSPEEAHVLLNELRVIFPQYKKEMTIKDEEEILLPLD